MSERHRVGPAPALGEGSRAALVFRPLAVLGVLAAGCGGDDDRGVAAEPDAEVVSAGQVALSWTLVDGEEPITCEEVGVVSTALTAIPRDGFVGEVLTRRCEDGRDGVVLDMEPGSYKGRVELISVAGVIGERFEIDRLDVESGQEVVVDPIVFDVPRSGGASFRVQARPFDDNCDESGPPAIEEMRIELYESGGDCVPVVFDIDEGAGDAEGEYAADCAGAAIACVEHDQPIDFSGVPPGSYLLDIVARDASGSCFGLRNSFEIAGGGLVSQLSTLLLADREGCGDLEPAPPDAGVTDAGLDVDAGVADAGEELDAGEDD